jgi:hypothetical protein
VNAEEGRFEKGDLSGRSSEVKTPTFDNRSEAHFYCSIKFRIVSYVRFHHSRQQYLDTSLIFEYVFGRRKDSHLAGL